MIKTLKKAVSGTACVAAAIVLTPGGPASAASVVDRDTLTYPFSVENVPDDCRPGITGNLAGMEVFAYQEVQTPQGYHFHATITDTGRIDWSDGSYSTTGSVDHPDFNAGPGTTIFTNAHKDWADTYTAAGVFISHTTFHLVEHVTTVDGVPEVSFEKGHFHFFDGC